VSPGRSKRACQRHGAIAGPWWRLQRALLVASGDQYPVAPAAAGNGPGKKEHSSELKATGSVAPASEGVGAHGASIDRPEGRRPCGRLTSPRDPWSVKRLPTRSY
jgi:hypothetical protein